MLFHLWSVEKSYLVRFGGAGACFPFLLVGRRICTKLLLLVLCTGPPVNVLSLLTAPSDEQRGIVSKFNWTWVRERMNMDVPHPFTLASTSPLHASSTPTSHILYSGFHSVYRLCFSLNSSVLVTLTDGQCVMWAAWRSRQLANLPTTSGHSFLWLRC
jgi:hypothetical protein